MAAKLSRMPSGIGRRILLGCILVLCLPQAAMSSDDEPQEGACYNYRTWNFTVKDNKLTLNVSESITIFNERGKEYNRIFLGEGSFFKLKSVKAVVRDGDGNVIFERKKGDFTKSCGYGGVSLYADNCFYYVTMEAASYPQTIEYEYCMEFESLHLWPSVQLRSPIPTKQLDLKLTLPPALPFRYNCYGMAVEPPTVDSSGTAVNYHWHLTDIEALEEVKYVPDGRSEAPHIRFAAGRFEFAGFRFEDASWREIGRWYNRLSEDRYQSSRLINGVGATSDKLANLREIYEFVTDKVRYVSVAIGMGGWQPHKAEQTLGWGYGDCKDMATLVISEARNMGIEAYPALVKTRDEGFIDIDFPDFDFNHVIAMAIIDGDTVWMDATCNDCPFGELPTGDQDIWVLVMGRDGGQIRRTPAAVPEDNRTRRVSIWSLNDDLSANLSLTAEITGTYARYLRASIPGKTKDEVRRFVDRQFAGAESKYRIDSYEISDLDNLSKPVTISVWAHTLKPARKMGKTIYFDPFVLNELLNSEKADLSDRTHPIDTYYPRLVEDSIVVSWESSLGVDSVVALAADSVDFAWGGFNLSMNVGDLEAQVSTYKYYRCYEIEPIQFGDFEIFRDRAREALSQHVKLVLK